VLAALRRAGARSCSGETLSRELGVSRAQVWKHVEALRARGYAIDGEPGGGYRLTGAPDRLYPEELAHGLATRWLGHALHWHDEIDSTNRAALELARAGAPAGTAVVAEAQTAGRGRLGRAFFSPAHVNLYVSIVLRPALSTTDAPTLILASAVAVADAVAAALDDPARVEIKWPNDVLVDGRKVSGILMELGAEAARVAFCVLGIGVNLNVDPRTFPVEFRDTATSLAAASGAPVDRAAFTRTLFQALEGVLDQHARAGFAALRPRFEARFRMPGRRVRVRELDGAEIEGIVRGIDADGALRIERTDGREERVIAGDVTLAKEGRAA
jgi:BirA family biotin operon repressor/biotin-[acetyl-CoA-carboxylase] ligase